MVHHACHSPCSFPQDHVPGRLLPLIRRDAMPELGAFVALGSSSSFYTSIRSVSGNTRVNYGDNYIDRAARRLGGGVTYVRDNVPTDDPYHFGATGATLANQLSNGMVNRAIAGAKAFYEATGKMAVIFCQAGSNDIGATSGAITGAQLFAHARTVMDRVEAENCPGIHLVFPKLWPRLYNASGPDEAVVLVQRLAYNALLAPECAARGHGCLESESVCARSDSGFEGYVRTDCVDANRPGHGAVIFAETTGELIYQYCLANLKVPAPVDLLSMLPYALPGKNHLLTGGGAGVRPTGYSGGNAGASTHTVGVVPHETIPGAYWFRITVAANGGNGYSTFSWSSQPTTGFTTGDIVEACCMVRFPQESGFAIGAVDVSTFGGGSFFNPYHGQPRVALQSPPLGLPWHPGTMLYRTLPDALTSGTTSLGFTTRIFGSGVVDICLPMVLINAVGMPAHFIAP